MRRGFAIALVYLGLLADHRSCLGALIVPPFVTRGQQRWPTTRPATRDDVTDYVQKNRTLRKLNEDYDITSKLQTGGGQAAEQARRGRRTLRDVGVGHGQLDLRPRHDPDPHRVHARQRAGLGPRGYSSYSPRSARSACERRSTAWRNAVGGYVAGALSRPRSPASSPTSCCRSSACRSRAPLAVLIVSLRPDPAGGRDHRRRARRDRHGLQRLPDRDDHLGHLVDRLPAGGEQRSSSRGSRQRTVQVHPFVVLVSVLFGATLLGVLGRPGGHPGRRLDPDRRPRVVGLRHRKPDIQIETSSPPPSPPSEPGPAGASA